MKKYVVLKQNDNFNTIINEGKKITNSHFIVYFLPSIFFKSNIPKIGISVGKKLGNAPFRNKQRRKLRMIVQSNTNLLLENHYVIIMRPRATNVKFTNLEEKYIAIMEELHEK